MTPPVKLSPQETRLLDTLRTHQGVAPIQAVFWAVHPEHKGVVSSRYMQQRLGPTITRMNRKYERHGSPVRVRPGRTKRTYALVE